MADDTPFPLPGIDPTPAAPAAIARDLLAGAVDSLLGAHVNDDPYCSEPFGSLSGDTRFVEATDGVELWMDVDEPVGANDQTPTVVFIHGYSLRLDAWHFQRKAARERARVVLFDHRSHGRSQKADREQCTIEQLGQDLARVIDATTSSGPVIVVGHSMGGMTILSLAQQEPERFGDQVTAAVLCNSSSGGFNRVNFGLPSPVARVAHDHISEVGAALAKQARLIQLLKSQQSPASVEFTKVSQLGPHTPYSVAKFVDRMMCDTPIDVMAEFLPAMETYDKYDVIDVLNQVSTTLISGARDTVLPASHSRLIASAVDEAELVVIPDVGHVSPLEAPEIVSSKVLEHIAAVR